MNFSIGGSFISVELVTLLRFENSRLVAALLTPWCVVAPPYTSGVVIA